MTKVTGNRATVIWSIAIFRLPSMMNTPDEDDIQAEHARDIVKAFVSNEVEEVNAGMKVACGRE